MEDLFTIIKLNALTQYEKMLCIASNKHLDYFENDDDSEVRRYARKQKHKQEYVRINKQLKTLGWQSE